MALKEEPTSAPVTIETPFHMEIIQHSSGTAFSVIKPLMQTEGISISRVKSGEFTIYLHKGTQEIVIDLNKKEIKDFSITLTEFIDRLSQDDDP